MLEVEYIYIFYVYDWWLKMFVRPLLTNLKGCNATWLILK